MKRLRALIRRVAGLFSGTERERELSDEIESHLQMHIDDNLRAGMTSQEARRQAMLRLGGVEKTKQTYRERGTLPLVEDVLGDLRFALRQLVKHPGFAVTAIVVLALGIGVSVAIFGFVDAALLEPLPYASPGRLMSVNESSVESPRWPLSYLDYLDWQRLNKSFSSLDVYSGTGYILRSSSGAEPVQAERVSGSFFQTLGVRPMLGRDFYADENRPGGPDVLLLSYGAWLHRFGARADVLGHAVDLDGSVVNLKLHGLCARRRGAKVVRLIVRHSHQVNPLIRNIQRKATMRIRLSPRRLLHPLLQPNQHHIVASRGLIRRLISNDTGD